jgi:hypothetical protein
MPYRIALISILGTSLAFMMHSSFRESAIMDELAHIPAGYGYVRYLDYRLNPEHPPLVKAIAALPLLAMDLKFPTESKAWTTDINGQWDMGSQFLYESGNDANAIVRASRMGAIFLTLVLALVIYLWSAKLLGRAWALLPTFLFAWSPQTLAHGHYVTTDIGATLGIVLALWRFTEFVTHPSRRNLLLAGLAFGVAQALKFSAVLLIPFLLLILIIRFIAEMAHDWHATESLARFGRFSLRAGRYLRSLIVIFAIGYLLVVYPLYALFTVNYPVERQVSDTTATLASFAGGPMPTGARCSPLRCAADFTISMSHYSLTRPFAEYALGVLMVIQRASGGNTNYFDGLVSAAGSRAYFPAVYALKEPLPILILVFIALMGTLLGIVFTARTRALLHGFSSYVRNNFALFSMLSFIIFYWGYSMKSPLNIGVRHLFPTFPLIYMLVASYWKQWLYGPPLLGIGEASAFTRFFNVLKAMGTRATKAVALAILLLWYAGGTVSATPHFISYFNEIGGGVWGGYRYVTDSNYDWGQDLLALKQWVEQRTNGEWRMANGESEDAIKKIAVDYFGGGSPRYELGMIAEPWWSSKGNPKEQGIAWLAVSVNSLQGAMQPTAPGFNRKPEDEYSWLLATHPKPEGMGALPAPDYRVGTSIFIYKL